MVFKDRVHLLSDKLEGDVPIAWRRDWPSLLVLALVTLLTGPWPMLALWIQRWNVRTIWDTKDHWEGTKQCAKTFVIIDILLIIAFIQFRSISFGFARAWLFYQVCFCWLWWMLLVPVFALIIEHIDPRTQRIRRVLLPREHPPAVQSRATNKAAKQSPGKKKAATRKKGKGRPVPLGQLLIEEKAEMEQRRTRINFIQPQSLSNEVTETQAAEPSSTLPGASWPSPDETNSLSEPPVSKKLPEQGKPESLDDLF